MAFVMGRVSDAKSRLLEATIDLVWARSYGAVTVDDICEAAGVKKGSFYYFFKSKDELVAAALNAKWESVRPTFDQMFSPTRPALERIQRAFDYIYQNQKELSGKHGCVLGCPFSSIGTEIISASPVLRDTVQTLIRQKVRYFESALRDLLAEGLMPDGQDPAVLARQVYLYYEGVLAQARILNDVEMLRGVFDGAMKLIGVRPPAAIAS